jgi:hypothetical protein
MTDDVDRRGEHASEGLPLVDRAGAKAVGKTLVWLGKRALRRGDFHQFNHIYVAVMAGNTASKAILDLPSDRTLKPGDPIIFSVPTRKATA